MQVVAPVDFFRERFFAGDLSGAASADEGSVLVVGFEGSSCRAGRGVPRPNRVASGGELHFADQLSTPGLIDARANFALHAFKLLLPRLSVRCQFQAAALAPQRTCMLREGFANDRGPRARKPRHRCFGPSIRRSALPRNSLICSIEAAILTPSRRECLLIWVLVKQIPHRSANYARLFSAGNRS